MHIAIIVRKLNLKGGVQRHALSVARELKNLGHRVKLYTFVYDKEQCYPELLHGLDVVSLGELPQPSRSRALGYLNFFVGLMREAAAAKKLALRIDPATEILNPHDHVCYKVAYFYKRKHPAVPSVWTMHDMPTKMFSYLRERALGKKPELNLIKKVLYKLLDAYETRKYIGAQDAVAVLDARDKAWVRQYFGKEAAVVRNGVDAQQFTFRPREKVGTPVSILMNGIFMPHRRFEDGIEALQILINRGYDARLSIVGGYRNDDRYFQTICNLIDRSELHDRVKLCGTVSEKELFQSYAAHDVFLFPNHLQSWGLAVSEAMASGLPVVVSKSAGASEVLEHRKNAMVVPAQSPSHIAEAIIELIQKPALYRTLSYAGRQFVEQELPWSKTARTMEAMFKQCVHEAS